MHDLHDLSMLAADDPPYGMCHRTPPQGCSTSWLMHPTNIKLLYMAVIPHSDSMVDPRCVTTIW